MSDAMNVLACWLGGNDLNGLQEDPDKGPGPIAQALAVRRFDQVVVLCNYSADKAEPWLSWIRDRTALGERIQLVFKELDRPTNHGAIYQAAREELERLVGQHGDRLELTVLLSPGTPAMHAVWLLLAKTRFPAEMIETTRDGEVWTTDAPFDIVADYLPELYRKPDQRLRELTAGEALEAPAFSAIVHRSAAMRGVLERARLAAVRSVPVLIEGESGTGKELLARAIHNESPRRDGSLIVVNCGAIPRELVESQLFGSAKGAFTGATRDRKGLFEAASGGTLFLDEVGELEPSAQVKLLRVLQEGTVTRVGEVSERAVDVRVIAATNRTLVEEVAAERFREDLFYRLAVAVLRLPPLRERPADIGPLIDHLLEVINQTAVDEPGYVQKKLSVGARKLLLAHRWPGNVRELQNTLTRAAIWSGGARVNVDEVREALLEIPSPRSDSVLERPLPVDLPEILENVKKHYLERALTSTHDNMTRAASLVGLNNYQTFRAWLAKCRGSE